MTAGQSCLLMSDVRADELAITVIKMDSLLLTSLCLPYGTLDGTVPHLTLSVQSRVRHLRICQFVLYSAFRYNQQT